MAAAAAVVALAGLLAILYGIAYDDLPRSIGGLGLTIIGLTVIALITIRKWVTDTRAERQLLAASQREAQAQKFRYLTAQAALEVEQGRLRRDIDSERRAITIHLKAEREAMAREFDEQRATVISETVEASFLMFRSGKVAAARTATGKLIQMFPQQHPQHQEERARSRERGVVGP